MIDFNIYSRELKEFKKLFVLKEFDRYRLRFERIFMKLYAFNYFSNRIEVSESFDNDYFKHVKTCIFEAFLLLADGYCKGCNLVMRSALENYNKFLLEAFNETIVSDRSYSLNHVKLFKYVEKSSNPEYISHSIKLINKRETYYSSFSAISHSLGANLNGLITYFADFTNDKSELMNKTLDDYNTIIDNIILNNIIICSASLKEWDSKDLFKFLNFWKDKKRAEKYVEKIKNNSYHY